LDENLETLRTDIFYISVNVILFPTYSLQDAEAHGAQKKISSYVALLEHNSLHPQRGAILLRYVACTADNAPYMLGKAFYEDMKGIRLVLREMTRVFIGTIVCESL